MVYCVPACNKGAAFNSSYTLGCRMAAAKSACEVGSVGKRGAQIKGGSPVVFQADKHSPNENLLSNYYG